MLQLFSPSVETRFQWQLKSNSDRDQWPGNALLWLWYVWYGHSGQYRTAAAGRITNAVRDDWQAGGRARDSPPPGEVCFLSHSRWDNGNTRFYENILGILQILIKAVLWSFILVLSFTSKCFSSDLFRVHSCFTEVTYKHVREGKSLFLLLSLHLSMLTLIFDLTGSLREEINEDTKLM